MNHAYRTILVSAAVFAILAGFPVVGQADGSHQHFDLGIFTGTITFDDVVDSDNGPLFGIRAAYDFNLKMGVEFVAAYQQSNMDSDPAINREHVMGAASFIYSFRFDGDQVVVPYVGAGIGAWKEDTDNRPSQNEGIVHGVAGVRFRATKHIALLIDVREWFAPWYNPYRGNNVNANSESAQFHFAYRF